MTDEGMDWARVLLSLVDLATQAHSSAQQADDEVLAQAVSALGLFLLLAPHAVGSRFAETGGYAALEGMLCHRRLTLPQQRACAQGMQSWLVPPGDGVLASPRWVPLYVSSC